LDEPRRRHDPLALAVIGAAVLLLVALVAGLIYSVRSAPAPAPVAPKAAPAGPSLGERISEVTRQVAKEIADAVREDRPMKVPRAPAKQAPGAKAPAAAAAAITPHVFRLPDAGRSWRYAVTVEPPVWSNPMLIYRLAAQGGALVVNTEFHHGAGNTSGFVLGTLTARHPSHASMRFPGFFMYPVYLDAPLEPGRRFSWQWPWQLPDGRVREGRVKRFEAVVAGWEPLATPTQPGRAVRIDVAILYVEDGNIAGTVREKLWYTPQAAQIVKVMREGRSPDEAAHRIVAELIQLP
jgi:hypothetical protein